MLAQRLSGIEISTIWDVLYRACEDIALYFGGSVLLGNLIGGVVGAFGGGIGAVPGATLGGREGRSWAV